MGSVRMLWSLGCGHNADHFKELKVTEPTVRSCFLIELSKLNLQAIKTVKTWPLQASPDYHLMGSRLFNCGD